MSRIPFLVSFCACVLFGPTVIAQRTYVVDQAGGSGAHFKDLPQALQIARHGDTLILRAGKYSGAQTSLGITVLGEKGASITASSYGLSVLALPAGRRFVLRGVAINNLGSVGINLSSNLGSVHLDDVQVTPPYPSWPSGIALVASKCSLVTINGSDFEGRPPFICTDTHAVVTASVFRGQDAQFNMVPVGSHPGIRATGSKLWFATTAFSGGKEAPSLQGPQLASPGLWLDDTETMLVGPCLVVAGKAVNPVPGMAALYALNSKVSWSSDTRLVPSGQAHTHWLAGNATATQNRAPALIVKGDKPGGKLLVDVLGQAGDAIGTFASVPAAPLQIPLGTWWLDLRSLILVDAGGVGASRRRQFQVPIPKVPSLRGSLLALQSIAIRLAPSQVLSNGTFVVLD